MTCGGRQAQKRGQRACSESKDPIKAGTQDEGGWCWTWENSREMVERMLSGEERHGRDDENRLASGWPRLQRDRMSRPLWPLLSTTKDSVSG